MTYANTRREIRRHRAQYLMRYAEERLRTLTANAQVLPWEYTSFFVFKGALLHVEWEKKFQ